MDMKPPLPQDMLDRIMQAVQMEYEGEKLLTTRGWDNGQAITQLEQGAERLMDNVVEYCKTHGVNPQIAWDAKHAMISQIDPYQHFGKREFDTLDL
jgi:hypothetical protein